VAMVRPSRAMLSSSGAHIEGNFLLAGEAWDMLCGRLAAVMPATASRDLGGPRIPVPGDHRQRATPGKPSGAQLVPAFPSFATQQLAAAKEATARLRADRCLEIGCVVLLNVDGGSVRISPIEHHNSRVEVPFAYQRDKARLSGCRKILARMICRILEIIVRSSWTCFRCKAPRPFCDSLLSGAIQLKSQTDPLGISVQHMVGKGALEDGWSLALRAYAELTCVEQRPISAPVNNGGVRPRSGKRGRATMLTSGKHQAPRVASRRVGRVRISNALFPDATTRNMLASYVVGHRRVLPDGHRPSRAAADHARLIGIGLLPGQTRVHTHIRGIAKDELLTFRWDLS
jgi:hypothetical protein